jgi:hypothetical protein
MLLVYMPAMAGVGFSSHFCEGKYKSTDVFSFSKQSCCCGETEKDDCCSDQIKVVKLEKDQLGQSNRVSVKQLSQISALAPLVYSLIFAPLVATYSKADSFYLPPLLVKKTPILFCTFLI